MNTEYDVNDERIARINYLLAQMPKTERRIDAINNILFHGGIDSSRFYELVKERSLLIKQYDDMQREASEVYRIIDKSERKHISVTSNNLDL